MPTPLERVFEAAGCRTQVELADFLGIRQSSIADAKKRASVPSDWLLTLWRKRGINPDWILWGKGEMQLTSGNLLQTALPLKPVYIKVVRPPEEL